MDDCVRNLAGQKCVDFGTPPAHTLLGGYSCNELIDALTCKQYIPLAGSNLVAGAILLPLASLPG
jgi:SAM-dependent MidA family methyltransferase